MKRYELNGVWKMVGNGFSCTGNIPGSLYSFLLENKLMDDPFYRDNELKALELASHDYEFSRTFTYVKKDAPVFLCCDGLDTLTDITINGTHVAKTDNMHRRYRFDVTALLKNGENEISILFYAVDPYIKKLDAQEHLPGSADTLRGFSYLRKAHCMLGWDWGPRLPDMGIWRDIYLLEADSAEITDFRIEQRHDAGRVFVTPYVCVSRDANVTVTVTTPDGKQLSLTANEESEIENPALWWPNTLGEQHLYTFVAVILENGIVVDRVEKRIGLRTLELIREKDVYGESFYHKVNGVAFFAMGADYIPEDNILSRIIKERSKKLLLDCKAANFNAIRVWGGGYYPDDWFFDLCDEIGLVVFLDLMFACAMYPSDREFRANIEEEIRDNILRFRHHACIALICGNNELELSYRSLYGKSIEECPFKQTYYEIFEGLFPTLVKELCPDIPYVSSSPTSGGHFLDPQNDDYGDSHYWDVWHKDKPFIEYRKHYFRYLSEFGFQSFPCEKTVNAFTEEGDRNIFSRVMEQHQRNGAANGKILSYLSATFLYPQEFGTLLYASQLLQAEAIRCGVEHLRRNRGRCMGTLYWQLNDIWPVASWASIDYYGRWKALHYVAKRFFEPIMISCEETGETMTRKSVNAEHSVYDYATKAKLCVHNDTLRDITGTVRWALRDAEGSILKSDETQVFVSAMSVTQLDELDFCKTDVQTTYISYELEIDNEVVSSGTALFTAPKHFAFRDPHLRYEIDGDSLTVYADAYAKYVEIDSPDCDFRLSDNYFDMNAGQKTVKIIEGSPKNIRLRSVFNIR